MRQMLLNRSAVYEDSVMSRYVTLQFPLLDQRLKNEIFKFAGSFERAVAVWAGGIYFNIGISQFLPQLGQTRNFLLKPLFLNSYLISLNEPFKNLLMLSIRIYTINMKNGSKKILFFNIKHINNIILRFQYMNIYSNIDF